MIDLGDTITFSALLYDKDPAAGGVLVNPVSAALTITLPPDPITGISSVLTPTITVPPTTTGTFSYALPTTLAGRTVGRWLFTMAPVNGITQTTAYSEVHEVQPADPGFIIGLASAKKHLNIPASVTTDDEEIRDWLAAVTRVVEGKVGICTPRIVTDKLDSSYSARVIVLRHTPVISIISIVPAYVFGGGRSYTAAETAVTEDGQLTNLNGWQFLGGPWTITYLAGRTIIPPNITQAAKIILGHIWQTQRGAGTPAYLGGDDVTSGTESGFSVPNRALELLEPDNEGPGVA
jgi:hypothetical protein